MQLYLTHIGRMCLRYLPIDNLMKTRPYHVSFRSSPTKYHHINADPQGVLWINDLLAGFYSDRWTQEDAKHVATTNHTEIVAWLQYKNLD